MKQIVIISGKGGTGKTVFAGSIAALAESAVIADCDVDASNLHFLLHPEVREEHAFSGGEEAVVDPDRCTGCMQCKDVCRFQAVEIQFPPPPKGREIPEGRKARIDPIMCEGCGVCAEICPEKAIRMEPRDAGSWYVSETKAGTMVHAALKAGEENSGKLVAQVRKKAKAVAEEENKEYVLIDGPPGTGCAVISSLSGVDMAVIVTEPSFSGIHDMKRVLELADHFSIKTGVVINKATVNGENTEEIRTFCRERNIPLFGEIPYSKRVVEAVSECVPYVEYADDEVSNALKDSWRNICKT